MTDTLPQAKEMLVIHGWSVDNLSDERILDIAQEILYEQLVEQKLSTHADNLFQFDTSKNCTNCDGWDGESDTCECGRAEVIWIPIGVFPDMKLEAFEI